MNILVVGGAGYIGSAAVKALLEANHEVTVLDNLDKGIRSLVDPQAKFIEGSLLNEKPLNNLFSENRFEAVMHFASLKAAGESMTHPEKYSENITSMINLLNAMSAHKVKKIIFSSSAAVYGTPQSLPLTEESPLNPENYYGFTKLVAEQLLDWYEKLKGIQYISLRYFNVAGDAGLNYIDPEANNIFPIIGEVLQGKRPALKIFGKDYETRDGTPVRDYIHVIDLVDAHLKALKLESSEIINLGSAQGYTVLELIKAFESVSKKTIPQEIAPRRSGDPAELYASNDKAKSLLGWEPKHDLNDMVESTIKAYEPSPQE
ncbi:UDP-glucose 4-epimerase GalE [Candidatus Pacearchaeota archaeon]|nr:UDP-glucose 4-epimerase GalE [Candidatus Pacearchaeota archaeon]|tara:strand:+ start:555 stop:1508 length:954 start_codon:yes stop_codon:yes gene_type:complete